MNYFKEDLLLSHSAQPFQNNIYKKIFPIKEIDRFTISDNMILDIKYHIDVVLKLKNGALLLGQEKALRADKSSFNTFTMEFYQDRFKKIEGEFFNLGAQFYMHGYLNGNTPESVTGFIKWYIIKIFDFIEYLKHIPIEELERHTRPSRSKASFFYLNYDKIPKRFIYKSYKDKITTVGNLQKS